MGPRSMSVIGLATALGASALLAASAGAVPPTVPEVGGKAPPVSGQVEFEAGFGTVNPGDEPPAEQRDFPLDNFTVSDTPANMHYAFQAGSFIGDYNNVAIGPDNQAFGFWTDARNGRSSRLGGPSPQPGRNPICEQSDVFADSWSAQSGGSVDRPKATDELFLVTPCPVEAREP